MAVKPISAAEHARLHLMAALARFFSLPVQERLATCEAAFLLLIVRIALALLPLAAALRLFGIKQGAAAAGRIDQREAEVIARAIARSSRHVPFRAVCLQQAFAALLMLRRRGLAATVHFGVLREGEELKAHAWSRCGEIAVTGAAAAGGFTPVAVFAA
jgi:hypothetical protein